MFFCQLFRMNGKTMSHTFFNRAFVVLAGLWFGALGVPNFLGAATSPGKHVRVIQRWSTPSKPVLARWAPNGVEVVYHFMRGKQAVIERFHVIRNKRKVVAQGSNTFYPCFGPAGTIVSGPQFDQTHSLRLAIPRRTTKRKPKAVKKPRAPQSRKRPPQTRKTTSQWWKQQNGVGVTLQGLSQKTFLFPGFFPTFSQAARRLLFSYSGILYLWNPLQTRRKGLLLLSRGYAPRWSHDGRAIAWLRKPFLLPTQRPPSGGGVVLVDMLFRAARVTKSGGQVSWAPDNRSLFFVDKPKGKARVGIFHLSLRKRKTVSALVRVNAWSPALPVRLSQQTRHLLAFANAKGVWLMHRKTKKSRLIAPGGTRPVWSSQQTLLVHYPKGLAVLRLSPHFQKTLQ